jgi:predicted ester cyclase
MDDGVHMTFPQEAGPIMTDEAKRTVREFYESYNDRDLDTTWERYLASDLVNHAMGGAYQRTEWLGMDKALFPAFADLRVKVLDQVSEGDKVATRYVITGTQTGEFLGIPASGNKAALAGTAFDRVAGGKTAEHWADIDLGTFMKQLTA